MRVVLIMLILLLATNAAAETYTWEDSSGIHFVDDISKVPQHHLRRVKAKEDISGSPATESNAISEPSTGPQHEEPTIKTYPVLGKLAVGAVQRLAARTRAGVSYKDYGPALGEAEYHVNSFLSSPESSKYSEIASAVRSAMADFYFAGDIWQQKIAKRHPSQGIDRYSSLGEKILQYPGANDMSANGGVIVDSPWNSATTISFDLAIKAIWRSARNNSERAALALNSIR